MATHSSILAWRIPRMEEPGRLQSMGSQRVGHDWATSLSLSSVQFSCSVLSDSSRPHGPQPTRLLCPWDFPGKSTGVGCHHLLLIIGIRVLQLTISTTKFYMRLSFSFKNSGIIIYSRLIFFPHPTSEARRFFKKPWFLWLNNVTWKLWSEHFICSYYSGVIISRCFQ